MVAQELLFRQSSLDLERQVHGEKALGCAVESAEQGPATA